MLLGRQHARRPTQTRGTGFAAAFRQGMLTNVLNSKSALFYLAFLPQFVSLRAAHPQLGLLVLGAIFIDTGLGWSLVLAMAGGRIHCLCSASRRSASGWIAPAAPCCWVSG